LGRAPIYCMFTKSPLNYVGGKYKLLPQLLKLFPSPLTTFVDLFCGGLNVSMNVEAERYVANDISRQTVELFEFFKNHDKEEILKDIYDLIRCYGISKTNEDGYYNLRHDYNAKPDPAKLMVLVSNSFNHQMRFNSKDHFNMPFGKERSCFNSAIERNLINLIDFLHAKNITFTTLDSRQVPLTGGEFVYADPPYQNTTAVYNTGWTERDDSDLLEVLDEVDSKGGKFALSCVLLHNGIENQLIKKWSDKYTVNPMDWKYGNSSYHKINRLPGREVCITNDSLRTN
jgi:DNA adenine methylase Dam